MIMHNMASPKQLSVITVGVTCLKLSKRSDCVSFLEHKTPKLHPHCSLQLYNHWPQSQSQVSNKRRTPLQRIPFLATCFSCLPKPVLLCSSSLKMFDNVVNGPSKPKICKADGCFFLLQLEQMNISVIFLGHSGGKVRRSQFLLAKLNCFH